MNALASEAPRKSSIEVMEVLPPGRPRVQIALFSWAKANRLLRLMLSLLCAHFTFAHERSALAQDVTSQSSKQVDKRNGNYRIVSEPNGRQIAELRWQRGASGAIGSLRIPVGYLWRGVGMLGATLGPNYPDPNIVSSSMQGVTLEALLPDFEPMTEANRERFADSFLGDVVRISINVAPAINKFGASTIDSNFRERLRDERSRSINGALFRAPFERKPDRYSLQRMGPVADSFDQFKSFGFVNDIYFPERNPKDVYLLCLAEEIRDVSEDSSWSRRPTCEQTYYSETLGAIVQLSYRRTRLNNWRVLQIRAEKLFQSFGYEQLGDSGEHPQ